ncbi:MAG: hypothetical protein KA715_01025 [Xanthomonadaceae bacterium]|nr:hypothetical protein [Xanthomonadaceae bacterium]
MSLAKKYLIFISLTIILSSCCRGTCTRDSADQKLETLDCPITDRGEKPIDCPWAGIARVLRQTEPKLQYDRLRLHLPTVANSLTRDSLITELRALWGKSINFDESAQKPIVDDDVIKTILETAQLPPPDANESGDRVHAGYMHTYAYLFSLLQTPYGFKRSRWVSGDIEKGLGLAPKIFHPLTEKGSFLANVTYFAGVLAFRGSKEATASIKRLEKVAHPGLWNLDYSKWKPISLVERLPQTEIRTDLLTFNYPDSKNKYLLIYSYLGRGKSIPKLITIFPIKREQYESSLNTTQLGVNKPIRSRFNAFIPGVTDSKEPLFGIRKIESL